MKIGLPVAVDSAGAARSAAPSEAAAARRRDVRLALTAAGRPLQSEEAEFDGVLAAGPAGANPRFGAAAREHGRLRRWVERGLDERLSAYAIVAPTERNFHSAGLFFAARIAARRLASLDDPRVVFEFALQERARA